jgi:beta-galactosidase
VSEAATELVIEANGSCKARQTMEIMNAALWDLDNPVLYSAKTHVRTSGGKEDVYTTEFGVRTIEFTSNDGFKLNGRRVNFQGVCMHHDLGPLGTAVNYRATERQMEIMKSMGVNALRTSHNPPSPEMLQVCDRLGIVVMVEAFDEWQIGKVTNGYHKYFDEWHEKDLRDMIHRDRNHPSVIMWSIGNEILEQNQPDGWKLAKHLSDICREEDPTRPTTAGFNIYPAAFENKLAYQVDLVGLNYKPLYYQEVLDANPGMIIYGSETSSQTSSRGIYHLPIDPIEQRETHQVSSYDVIVGPPWTYPPDVEFELQEKVKASLGEFIWTGIDYLGEPTPYAGRDNETPDRWDIDWPSRSSYFAPVDLSGFPKDRYFLYQSQWTEEPMVHVLPHWNWEGREGEMIPVFAYTNGEEVELFVNGESAGRKVKGVDLTGIPAEFRGFERGTWMSKYRLSWEVPYAPGSLKVVAYRDGKAIAEKEVRTAGPPAKISLIPDHSNITADGRDLSFITVRIEDKDGNFCPLADNQVKFKVSGDGSIAAVGNGDATATGPFQADYREAFNGLCLLILKSTEKPGTIHVVAESEGLTPATTEIRTL